MDGEAGIGLKPGSYMATWSGRAEVLLGSKCDSRYSQAGESNGGSSEFLQPTVGGGPTHISVQMKFLSEGSGLCFGTFQDHPKGILVTPHYLSSGHHDA